MKPQAIEQFAKKRIQELKRKIPEHNLEIYTDSIIKYYILIIGELELDENNKFEFDEERRRNFGLILIIQKKQIIKK